MDQDARLFRLEDTLSRLAEAQVRAEAAVSRLAEAQVRAEARMEQVEATLGRLAAAQARTEEQVLRQGVQIEHLTEQAQALVAAPQEGTGEKRRSSMRKTCILFVLLAVLAVTGCVSQSQFLDSKQAMAIQTAVSRGQFEMNCPEATPTLISREVIQPALQGPWVNGIQRAEYTIGVSGCGKRTTFVVVCPDGGEGCFGAGPGRFHDWQ